MLLLRNIFSHFYSQKKVKKPLEAIKKVSSFKMNSLKELFFSLKKKKVKIEWGNHSTYNMGK